MLSNKHKVTRNRIADRVEETKMAAQLPTFTHVLETILYTKNIAKAKQFYGGILRLKQIDNLNSDRGVGYELGQSNLLIFALGKTVDDIVDDPSKPEHKIPKHGPSKQILETLLDDSKKPDSATYLHQHYCLAVETIDEVKRWHQHLVENNVPITGLMNWTQGGHSVYFADPDDHVCEIASRGLWPNWR